jgi:hypothetical protein
MRWFHAGTPAGERGQNRAAKSVIHAPGFGYRSGAEWDILNASDIQLQRGHLADLPIEP